MILDFIKHIVPRVVRSKDLTLTYTFCFGGIALSMLLVLGATGVLSALYYRPSPTEAFHSVLFLEESVWGGRLIRSMHRMSSHALLVLLLLHTLRVVLTGAFAPPRQKNWVVGVLLCALVVFEAYTGYLLPMDQLAFWATQTGMTLLTSVPGGNALAFLLVPDSVGGAESLLRFYVLHIMIIPLFIAVLCMIHLFLVRRQKGTLPYL